MAGQRGLSDWKIEHIAVTTGLEREEVEALLEKIQSPAITVQQQLELLSQVTGRPEADVFRSIMAKRERRRDELLLPQLDKILKHLQKMRQTGGARLMHTVTMPFDSALRLATLLEQSREADGYVYSVSIYASPGNRHTLAITWRHPVKQLQKEMPLFDECSGFQF